MTNQVSIPSIDECLDLMDEYEMLNHIRSHSFMVARVAESVWRELSREENTQYHPTLELVLAGALLHDIAKTPCLKNGCNHAKLGGEICARHGYPKIGRIVSEHVILHDFDPVRYRQGRFKAKEIVYYADKRVRHDTIVSLDERLDYIIEHYGNGDKEMHRLIRNNFKRCIDLEDYLFSFIDFSPDDLTQHISPDPFVRSDPVR